MRLTAVRSIPPLLAALLVTLAAPLDAQRRRAERGCCGPIRGARAIALQVGAFSYDFGGDQQAPMAALRADWWLSPFVIAELGTMYAMPTVDVVLNPDTPEQRVVEERASIVGLDLGIQAQLPLGRVRPYAGLASGFVGVFEPSGGDRYFAPSQQAMVGVRVPLSSTIGLRGELRYRVDQTQSGAGSDNLEQTVGLSARW